MDTPTLIGLFGTLLILVAFFMNQAHRWRDTDVKYDVANLIGAGLLVWYSLLIAAWPFLILNGVWALISLKDVLKKLV